MQGIPQSARHQQERTEQVAHAVSQAAVSAKEAVKEKVLSNEEHTELLDASSD